MNRHTGERRKDGQKPENDIARLIAQLERECARLSIVYKLRAEYGYDPGQDAWWVQLSQWRLPEGFNDEEISLIFLLPQSYPDSAPIALLFPSDLSLHTTCKIENILSAESDSNFEGWSKAAFVTSIKWRSNHDLGYLSSIFQALLEAAVKMHRQLEHEHPMATMIKNIEDKDVQAKEI